MHTVLAINCRLSDAQISVCSHLQRQRTHACACKNIIHTYKESNLQYSVDRETVDVPT